MYELKREAMCDKTELMLFDILHELKNITVKLDNICQREAYEKIEVNKEFAAEENPAEEVKQQSDKPEKTATQCSYCGKSHGRPIDYAICAKKHKKEGKSK